MIFAEIFIPKDAFTVEQLGGIADRIRWLDEMTSGEETPRASAEVFLTMSHVVVTESVTWGGSAGAIVRFSVPAPWRKAMSEELIKHASTVLTEAGCSQVHVYVHGVSEGGIGIDGQVRSSQDLADMMGEPYRQDYEQGRAAIDPMCNMIAPLYGDDSITVEYDGTLYAFCSKGCREEFIQKQDKKKAHA